MDFHTLGSISKGYDNIFVIVDQLSKRHVSILTSKGTTTRTVTLLFYYYL